MIFKFQIKWIGANALNRYLMDLPPHVNEAAVVSIYELGQYVKANARLRASRGWTNNLANSIVLEGSSGAKGRLVNEITLSVGASYGDFVEKGQHPFIIPVEYIEQHLTMPGSPGTDTRLFGLKPRAWVMPRPALPFMAPAVEAGMRMFPTMISNNMDKGMR
jgi:hypothetical protein